MQWKQCQTGFRLLLRGILPLVAVLPSPLKVDLPCGAPPRSSPLAPPAQPFATRIRARPTAGPAQFQPQSRRALPEMESKALLLVALGVWLQSLTAFRGGVAATDGTFSAPTPLHLRTLARPLFLHLKMGGRKLERTCTGTPRRSSQRDSREGWLEWNPGGERRDSASHHAAAIPGSRFFSLSLSPEFPLRPLLSLVASHRREPRGLGVWRVGLAAVGRRRGLGKR